MTNKKLVHVQVVDGDIKQITALKEAMSKLKKDFPDMEFLITNDAIQLRDVKYLIDHLYKLYKSMKEDENGKEKK